MIASAPPASIDDLVAAWRGRAAFAIVDLDAFASNIQALRAIVGPEVVLTSVVKSNAYGHGAVPLAKAAVRAGADEVAVATVDEGVQLRGAGIDSPILVMGPIGDAEVQRAVGHGLQLVVSDAGFAGYIAAEARHAMTKEPVAVHLKIDTGMRRFGGNVADVVTIAQAIRAHDNLNLVGLMSHLSSADDPDESSAHEQLAEFDRAVAMLADAGIDIPQQHIANSAATLRFPHFHRGRVRSGVAGYGLQPDVGMALPPPFRPIMTLHSRIARLIDLAPGDAVSYGRTYRATTHERAGLVPIGYGDGYRRMFSSKAHMAIHGQRAPVLGRVCMDQTVVRLPDEADVKVGDPVVIVGNGSEITAGAPTIDDLAALSGTISYELTCGLQARVPRLYTQGGALIAIHDLNGYREL
jgi:alanine racemase